MPYLTPDSAPPTTICRTLVIPDDPNWKAIVNGALSELIHPSRFEQFGTATPDEVTAVFQQMFFDYLESECAVPSDLYIVGEVRMFAFSPIPVGWLNCNGALVLRIDYPDLYAAIGDAYGSNDGSTNFKLPSMYGRFPAGAVITLPANDMGMGKSGGENSHVLTVAEMPAHSHKQNVQTGAGSTSGAFVQQVRSEQGARQTDVQGGGEAHENRPAYTTFAFGIYAGV